MANVYSKDSSVHCTVAFTLNSIATDPSVVTFYFKDGSGVETTYHYGTDSQLVKDSTGNYHVDLTTSVVGTWYYRFEGSGTLVAANENSFVVPLSQLV